jgi:hypothetical protein
MNPFSSVLATAQSKFDAIDGPKGDQLIKRMEEITTKNLGSCMLDLFNVIRSCSGKTARKPAKFMSMYPNDDDTSTELVRGPAIKTEVHKVATKINQKREVDSIQ